VPLPFDAKIKNIALGCQSDGPVLLTGQGKWPLGEGVLLHLKTLQPLPLRVPVVKTGPKGIETPQGIRHMDYVRAAANGTLFTFWTETEGHRASLIVQGDAIRFMEHGTGSGGNYLLPSPDGQLMVGQTHATPQRLHHLGVMYRPDFTIAYGGDRGPEERQYVPGAVGPYCFDIRPDGSNIGDLQFYL